MGLTQLAAATNNSSRSGQKKTLRQKTLLTQAILAAVPEDAVPEYAAAEAKTIKGQGRSRSGPQRRRLIVPETEVSLSHKGVDDSNILWDAAVPTVILILLVYLTVLFRQRAQTSRKKSSVLELDAETSKDQDRA